MKAGGHVRAIWKFPFEIADECTLQMPVGAKVLHLDMQRGVPTLWALVEPAASLEARTFRTYGTGHELDSRDGTNNYIGTFQGGAFVWHVFEKR